MSRWELPSDLTLSALAEKWLEDISPTIGRETPGLYRMHMFTHLIPHFGSPHGIQSAAIADYGRRRLRVVKRTTLQKERSTLRGFLAWCEEQGYVADPPDFPKLPRRATGTAFAKRRRGAATELAPEECLAMIALLPQWSRPRGEVHSYPVRARFIVMFETALRPATLDHLSVPEHYSRGSDTVRITDEIDKARFGRTLPLTDDARRALDGAIRGSGLIFGDHDYRYQLEKAAKAILPAAKARTFTAYDLRHARLTQLAEGGNLTGVAYLAGHKRVTTTSIYVRPGLKAAERALQPFEVVPISNARRLAVIPKVSKPKELCEGEDSNLHGSYPASTSIQSDSGTLVQHNQIRNAAVAILGAAAAGESVPEEALQSLARAALQLTAIGRLALGVLDGGPYAPRRAVELARAIVDGQARLERKEGEG